MHGSFYVCLKEEKKECEPCKIFRKAPDVCMKLAIMCQGCFHKKTGLVDWIEL